MAVALDGTIRAFDRTSGVPISLAVAASAAAPGSVAPVPIGQRRSLDGGISGTNIDQAVGSALVLALTPFPLPATREEIEAVAAHGGRVLHLAPDDLARRVMGRDTRDFARRGPASDAGVRQATGVAAEVRAFLDGGPQHATT
jgi:NTE family protein